MDKSEVNKPKLEVPRGHRMNKNDDSTNHGSVTATHRKGR